MIHADNKNNNSNSNSNQEDMDMSQNKNENENKNEDNSNQEDTDMSVNINKNENENNTQEDTGVNINENENKGNQEGTDMIEEQQENSQGELTEIKEGDTINDTDKEDTINEGTDTINDTDKEDTDKEDTDKEDTDTINDTDKKDTDKKEEEKTPAEKAKEKREKQEKQWARDLERAKTVIKAIQTGPEDVAWCPATAMTYFSIDIGEKRALKIIRRSNGGIPITNQRAEDIIMELDGEEYDRATNDKDAIAPRVPRFWTAGEKNDLTAPSYVYRGGIDYNSNPPLYRIDSQGVNPVNNSGTGGAVFTYSQGMETIPTGINEGTITDIEELWNFMNLAPEYRTLALGAVLAPAVNSHMDRPILFTTGPSESGKTTITERLSALIDPKPGGETSTRTNQGGGTIEQAALNTDTLIIGNISSISLAASNALCQIGSGSTRKERELYANGSNLEYVIRATAMISTKEEHIRLEDDLQTRIIPIPTTPLTPEQEATFPSAEEWEEALPRLQGAALSIISAIKKDAEDHPDLRFHNPYRWKGVGEVIERTERVLRQAGINVSTKWTDALKSARTILSHRSTPAWVDFIIDELSENVAGTPGAVLKRLKEIAGSSSAEWYVSQQNFRRELEQHQEVLKEAGVGVDIINTVGGKKPRYEIDIRPNPVNSLEDYIGDDILEQR